MCKTKIESSIIDDRVCIDEFESLEDFEEQYRKMKERLRKHF